jgi:hypothetical protein
MKYAFVGYESSVENDLRVYNKLIDKSIINKVPGILKKIGISVVPGYIMYNGHTTIDDLFQKIKFFLGVLASKRGNYTLRNENV